MRLPLVDRGVTGYILRYHTLLLFDMQKNIMVDKSQDIELVDMATRTKVIHIVIVRLVLVKEDGLAVGFFVYSNKFSKCLVIMSLSIL